LPACRATTICILGLGLSQKEKVRNAMQYNTHLITYMQQIYNEKQHNNKNTSLTCTAMYNPGTLNDSNIISIEKNYKEIISLVVQF
jgi:hypothetical protein